MNIEEYCYNKYIKSNDIVYDIGAHVGETSLLFASKGAKQIYSFEASILNFNELNKNTINYPNIKSFNVALHETNEDCITKFRDCRTDGELDREQPIKYVILQDFIAKNDIELPNFIKMDIEGMESIVLKTFNFLFNTTRPIIFVEVHAGPKNDPQNYDKNPHWRYPNEGGFDMNDLKKNNYLCIGKDLDASEDRDFNPKPKTHAGFILLPKELYN